MTSTILGIDIFLAKLMYKMLECDLENVEAAYTFSIYGHAKQMRVGGGRYFDHPKKVALILIEDLSIYDWRIIVTALLHDIREDTHLLSEYRLILNFGKEVALWVKLISKLPKGEEYIRRMIDFGIWQVLLVKLADRLHNISTIDAFTCEEQKEYIKETRKFYIPLADNLIDIIPEGEKWKAEWLKSRIEEKCN